MATQFLEVAVPAADVLDSLTFYRQLGFVELNTHGAMPYPYAVVSDGAVAIGLHGSAEFQASARFVRPDVRGAVLKMSDRGVEFADVHLDDDELHQVSLVGPNGNRVDWVEARTFSPADEDVRNSMLGSFLEITFSVADLYAAARFWAPYADRVLAESDEPPRMRLDASGLAVGLCETTRSGPPSLAFAVEDAEGLQTQMDRFGMTPASTTPPAGAFSMLRAPEGTSLALCKEDFI